MSLVIAQTMNPQSQTDIQKNCIFCRIASREVPAHIVYEDEDFIGFLDIHPAAPGHTLIIPRIHARWVHDVEPFGAYWEAARSVARQLEMQLSPSWVQYFTHGAITHAHIHVMPRYDDVDTAPPILMQPDIAAPDSELQKIADKIRMA